MTGRKLPAASEVAARPPRERPADIARAELERLGVIPRAAFLLPPDLRPEAADIAPTAERRRHDRIERAAQQMADARRLIGLPYIALSTLAVMQRAGTITPRQRDAGEEFHRLFRLAALDGLKAAALDRIPAVGGCNAYGAASNERARRMIGEAIRALGGEGTLRASCAWHVLGLEWSLRQWSEKALRGNVDRAAGAVIVTLEILQPVFSA